MDRLTIITSLKKVSTWVEHRNYKGYDPGDGLTSFLRPLTFGNLFAERVLQQVIWKSPVNLRPLVGVCPMDSTKGRGFMAWGYTFRFKILGDESDQQNARACFDWLDEHREKAFHDHCWGNHFDFTTRSGRMPAHSPTIVWSGLIGQAVLEGYETFGDAKLLDMAQSICRWILSLPREQTKSGSCLSYVAYGQSSIHNSNMLGGAMLARTWKHTRQPELLELARESMLYSCSRQLADGAWYYGEAPKHHWIDNFHTAYNLDSLKRYIDATGDETFRPHLDRGYAYFKNTFFETDGTPRYYHNKTYPIDIQCASQAIDTFAHFSEEDPDALGLASRVAEWTIQHMQSPSGYFYYRKLPLLTVRTPYFHWGQGTMFKALAHLLYARDRHAAVLNVG